VIMANRRLIVGVSGASGAPVTIELLQQLQTEKDLEVHLICSKWGLATLEHEAGVTRQDLEGLCTRAYDEEDRGAAPASGSFSAVGMAVVPCSMKTLAGIVANENPADVEALKACTYPGTDRTVADVTADKVLAIGENIQIRRFVRYAEGVNVPYIHMGGKIGVLVNLAVEGIEAGKVIELGKDVAMQIAAMNPSFLDKSDVSQETLDKEKEIQLAMMANDPKMAAKPEKVKEGIVMGKLGKYYEENCLLQQAFVKENKISVEKHVAAVAKELGGQITVKAFTRFATGEGIEKKEDDFAAEVASMIH